MGDSNVDGYGGGVAPRAIPRPGRVPEQRLVSPEIGIRRRQRCGTLSGKTPIDLGFLRRRDYIGRRAMSGGGPGGHTPWWRGLGVAHATTGCGWPWSISDSPLDKIIDTFETYQECRGYRSPYTLFFTIYLNKLQV
jgi:hypothetical protein